MKPPTIHDVARLAEVSKSTVSNVIRGMQGVSATTRTRVLAAVDSLGYRPNILARQLVQQRTSILGVVVGDFADPFHAEMMKEVERHAAAEGFRTMFVSAEGGAAGALTKIEDLLQYRVAGILFLADFAADPDVRRLVGARPPAVFVGTGSSWADSVHGDDRQGAALATAHLLERGHRAIGFFAHTDTPTPSDVAREQGYRAAMREAGIAPRVFRWMQRPETLVCDGNAGRLTEVMAGEPGITGMVCINDIGAIELMDCADRVGIAIPRELSVVGFDDVILARLARIDLTTVEQPRTALARTAIELLAARIAGKARGGPQNRVLEVALVARGSSAERR